MPSTIDIKNATTIQYKPRCKIQTIGGVLNVGIFQRTNSFKINKKIGISAKRFSFGLSKDSKITFKRSRKNIVSKSFGLLFITYSGTITLVKNGIIL